MPRMQRLSCVIVFGLLATLASGTRPSAAPDWPQRAVAMVVPFAAGGPLDAVGRIVAARLSDVLGQQVVVENVTGAGGTLGAKHVAKAAPDGYRFLYGNIGTHAYSQTLYRKPPYDALTDFAPVGLVAHGLFVLVVRKDLPVSTLPEFVAYAKANQAKMQYGSAGPGSATHISCVMLNMAMGSTIAHIPYRGAGPAQRDLLAGRIDFMCDSVTTALPQIQAGTVKAIANLAPTRTALLPDLATAREQGLAELVIDGWHALFFPKGTPEPIIRRLNKALGDTLDTPSVRARLKGLGLSVPAPERRSPEYLAKFVRSEIEKWAGPIKASGVSAD